MRASLMLTVFVLFSILSTVNGHGYMIEPPSRSSAYRVGFNTPKNSDDAALNCGGLWKQLSLNGKCGVCGDAYDGVRHNEAGGKYATGVIVRTYKAGSLMKVTTVFTANHKGWDEYRLCVNNNVKQRITQECLDLNLLKDDNGVSRFDIEPNAKQMSHFLRLPKDLTCSQCVLQWKWRGGNNSGKDQEEFYGCADIAIEDSNSKPGTSPTQPDEDEECDEDSGGNDVSDNGYNSNPNPGDSDTASGDTAPNSGEPKYCMSRSESYRSDKWCNINCNQANSNCPAMDCQCFSKQSQIIMELLMKFMDMIKDLGKKEQNVGQGDSDNNW